MKTKLLTVGFGVAALLLVTAAPLAWAGLKQAGADKTCAADPKCGKTAFNDGSSLYCISGGQHCLFCKDAKADCQVLFHNGLPAAGIDPATVLMKKAP